MTTENDLRRALMRRTDINAGTKLTLMAVLLRVDWQTWAGPCTAADLAQLAGISSRTVRYGLQKAEALNLISRKWGSAAGKAMPIISMHITQIITPADFAEPAKLAPPAKFAEVAKAAPPAKLAEPAESAPLPLQNLQPKGGNICTPTPAKSAPLQLTTNYQPNSQPIKPEPVAEERESNFSYEGVTDELASDDTPPTRLNKWHKLTDEQIAIIEKHCSFSNGFYERCRVARKHLNIRLHRGGYYEQL